MDELLLQIAVLLVAIVMVYGAHVILHVIAVVAFEAIVTPSLHPRIARKLSLYTNRCVPNDRFFRHLYRYEITRLKEHFQDHPRSTDQGVLMGVIRIMARHFANEAIMEEIRNTRYFDKECEFPHFWLGMLKFGVWYYKEGRNLIARK
jgi:hypothetical protein